jgi:hypothetical protein
MEGDTYSVGSLRKSQPQSLDNPYPCLGLSLVSGVYVAVRYRLSNVLTFLLFIFNIDSVLVIFFELY